MGAPFNLTSPPLVQLTSPPLSMWLGSITSQKASNLTGGMWDPQTGMGNDTLPEVPPDGVVQLQFSYPVELAELQSGLRLSTGQATNATSSSSGAEQVTVQSCSGGVGVTAPVSTVAGALAASTCAQVVLPPLAADTIYSLSLPQGVHYSSLSGALQEELNASVISLRPFQTPFLPPMQPTQWSGIKYRRLNAWLPHGLSNSSNATVQQIQGAMSLQVYASDNITLSDVPFNLSLINQATLQLSVPKLQPSQHYKVAVAGSESVTDGYGQPLLPTSSDFYTMPLQSSLQQPTTGSIQVIAPLDGSSNAYIVADCCGMFAANNHTASSINLIQVTPLSATLLFNAAAKPVPPPAPPSSTSGFDATNPSAADYAATSSFYQPYSSSSSPDETPLGSAVVWVTDTREGKGKPVEGATVQLFIYWPPANVTALPSCTTLPDGTCTIVIPTYILGSGHLAPSSFSLSALVTAYLDAPIPTLTAPDSPTTAGNASTFLTSSIDVGVGQGNPTPRFVASLVLDRQLYLPVDALHVTGYVQQVSANGAALFLANPSTTQASLIVTPSWTHNPGVGSQSVPVAIDFNSGSFHAALPVPYGAAPGQYTIQLMVSYVPASAIFSLSQPVPGGTSTPTKRNPRGPSRPGRRLLTHPPYSANFHPPPPASDLAANISVSEEHNFNAQVASMIGRSLIPVLNESGVGGSSSGSEKLVTGAVGGQGFDRMVVGPGVGGGVVAGGYIGAGAPTASAPFTIADPRTPSAELTLSLPSWAPPTSVVTLQVLAVSYIGASLDDAAMTATWSTALAQGTLVVTTNSSGMGQGVIDLRDLPLVNQTAAGDTLQVSVQWIGPTQELITQSGSVKLQPSPSTLQLTRSYTSDIPGLPFGVSVALVAVDGSNLPPGPLTVTLSPAPTNTTPGLLFDAACATTSSCSISSSTDAASAAASYAACQLSLPCTGTFQLTACPSPSQIIAFDVAASSQNVSSGNSSTGSSIPLDGNSTAQLSFQNPWGSASALLILSSATGYMSVQEEQVPVGPFTFTVPLTRSMLGGVTATVLLSIPRLSTQSASSILTAALAPQAAGSSTTSGGLVASKLFDPFGPHTHTLSVVLNVQPDSVLDVAIQIGTSNSTGPELVVSPGSNTTITVQVSQQGSPVSGAEITLVIVDKALLDLLPLPLENVTQTMALHLSQALTSSNPDDSRVAPGALDAVMQTALRRLLLDPWVTTNLNLQPALAYMLNSLRSRPGFAPGPAPGPANDVDRSDLDFFSPFTSDITSMPGCGAGACLTSSSSRGMAGPDGFPSAFAKASNIPSRTASPLFLSAVNMASAANSPASAAPAASAPPRLQSQFESTPLFSFVMASFDGVGELTFTAPSNLGTFVVRAYVTQGSTASYGSSESSLIVRTPLALTPALPRMVRVGDNFSAGVIVTLPQQPLLTAVPPSVVLRTAVLPPVTGAAVLQLQSGTSSADMMVHFLPGETQASGRFDFTALSVGTASLSFSAVSADLGGAADALVIQLDVLGPAYLATSFSLTGASGSRGSSNLTSAQTEGLSLPAVVPGSGSLSVTAGVGHLPSLISLFEALAGDMNSTTPDAYVCVDFATLPSLLALYQQPIPQDLLRLINVAFLTLNHLTDPVLGLQYSDTSQWQSWEPRSTDIVLNAWGASVLNSYRPPGPDHVASWATVLYLSIGWKAAAVQQLQHDAAAAHTVAGGNVTYSNWKSIAWTWLALGPSWQPQIACDLANTPSQANQWPPQSFCDNTPALTLAAADLALPRLLEYANSSSADLGVRLLVALMMQQRGVRPKHRILFSTPGLVADITSSLRVTGQTSYIAASPGASSAASLDTQAFALLVLTSQAQSTSLSQIIPRLTALLAQKGPVDTSGISSISASPYVSSVVALGLSTYDKLTGSAQPNLMLDVSVNSADILKAKFLPGSSFLQQSTTNLSSLSASPGPVALSVNGSGQVSVSLALSFVPLNLLTYPTYRGIYVESVLQLLSLPPGAGSNSSSSSNSSGVGSLGGSLNEIPLGAVVQLTVQLTSPDDLGTVVVEVRMPGGLEPVDPLLANSAGLSSTCALGDLHLGTASNLALPSTQWWWWWPVCPAQVTTPSMVTFTFLQFSAGTSSVTVNAVAATPGTFVMPPVKAYATLQPEVSGTTKGSQLTVCVPPCTTTFHPLPTLPQRCPLDCSGSGLCNLALGTCLCQTGYKGDSCSVAV
ncbi:MAG: hypothetical protein WDW36_004208 [Sanguina aurantia]